jgi:hypothetical protein
MQDNQDKENQVRIKYTLQENTKKVPLLGQRRESLIKAYTCQRVNVEL